MPQAPKNHLQGTSTFPLTMIECGEDADLAGVLARLRDKFDGLPSALATSCE